MKFGKSQRSCVFLSVDSFWNLLGHRQKEDMLVTHWRNGPPPWMATVESVKVKIGEDEPNLMSIFFRWVG